MFGRLKRLAPAFGMSFTPIMVGNIRYAYGAHLLVAPSVASDQRRAVMHALLGAVEAKAFQSGMGVCFDRVTEEEALLMQLLEERGYSRTIDLPVAMMDIEWDSLEGYLEYVRQTRGSKQTQTVRYEIQRNRKAGVNIYPLGSIATHEGHLHQLLVNHHRRYSDRRFKFKGFLSRAEANLGEDAVVYVAGKQGQLIAVCLLLKRRSMGYVLHVGVDHKSAGNDFTYFNLCYYRPAIDASGFGLKRLYFGCMLYDLIEFCINNRYT